MKKVTYIMLATTALTVNAFAAQQQEAAPTQNNAQNTWSRAVSSSDPTPANGFITDNQISTNFYAQVQNDRMLSDDTKRTVEIRVYNGKATLQGKVKNNKERALIGNIAKRIPGVESVKSNLSTRS